MHPRLLESPDSSCSDVRIWTAQVESFSEKEIDELSAHLDPAERMRATRFHFERDRKSYIATRGLLRSLLGATLHEDPSKIAFEYGEHGKPALKNRDPAIQFSVSHSAGWAMFAISHRLDVGVDLEAADRLNRTNENVSQVAARILSSNELAIWQALPDNLRAPAFLRAWTRKEAYAKATGRGLFDELNRIEVALDAAAPQASLTVRSPASEGAIARAWILHDLPAPEGFAAALAVEHKIDQSA